MIRHLAAVLVAFAAASVTAGGCGTRDLTIEVTGRGMGLVLDACRMQTGGCLLPSNPRISPMTLKDALQGRLVLADATGAVRATSACFELLPSKIDPGQDPAGWGAAVAAEVNQELEGALPEGLTYPGLQDPDEVVLTLAIYDPANTNGQCAVGTLIACAGFEPPLSGGPYDVSCASCQGGQIGAMGSHCPTAGNACFLEECAHIAAKLP